MARDLRIFYLFRLLATSYVWQPCFVELMLARGLTFGQVATLAGLYSAVLIVAEVPTGAFADRIGRRASMMVGTLAMLVSSLVSYEAHSMLVFGVAEGLAAVSMSLCSGADSAYLYDFLDDRGAAHEYAHRESVASAWHLIGAALACAAGGFLAEIDLALPYLATAGVALAAFLVAALLEDDGPRLAPGTPAPLAIELRAWVRHMVDAVRDVARSSRLAWLVGYSAIVFVLLTVTKYLYQPYLRGQHFSLHAVGLVYAGVMLVAAVVALECEGLRRRVGEDALLWILLGTLGGSFVLLSQVTGPWAVSLIGVQAFATGLYSPLVKPLLNREITTSSRRATVLSVESIVRRGTMAVFMPLAGLAGASSALTLCGGLGLGGLLVLALLAGARARATGLGGAPTVD
jgi:MFS family permease